MGICIEIKKINTLNDVHFYTVSSSDFGGALFIISIHKATGKLNFYLNNQTKCPILTYCLQLKCWLHGDPQTTFAINNKILPYVILQVQKALMKNLFPEHIGYAA